MVKIDYEKSNIDGLIDVIGASQKVFVWTCLTNTHSDFVEVDKVGMVAKLRDEKNQPCEKDENYNFFTLDGNLYIDGYK
jgi:hypothetical protein